MDINTSKLDRIRQSKVEVDAGAGEGAFVLLETVARKYKSK
jgi:hypothetical protein